MPKINYYDYSKGSSYRPAPAYKPIRYTSGRARFDQEGTGRRGQRGREPQRPMDVTNQTPYQVTQPARAKYLGKNVPFDRRTPYDPNYYTRRTDWEAWHRLWKAPVTDRYGNTSESYGFFPSVGGLPQTTMEYTPPAPTEAQVAAREGRRGHGRATYRSYVPPTDPYAYGSRYQGVEAEVAASEGRRFAQGGRYYRPEAIVARSEGRYGYGGGSPGISYVPGSNGYFVPIIEMPGGGYAGYGYGGGYGGGYGYGGGGGGGGGRYSQEGYSEAYTGNQAGYSYPQRFPEWFSQLTSWRGL